MGKKPSTRKRSSGTASFDPTAGPLAQRTFPEVAKALQSQIKSIVSEWEKLVRRHVPPAKNASFEALRDSVPEILAAMAAALASGDAKEVKRLMDRSPSQGIHRFEMHYDTSDLATEDRLLRAVIAERVGLALGRRTTLEEEAALQWGIDLMGQQAMVAFVTHQNERLRIAAEAELKYLSFLSHDLSGNLGNVTLWLQILKTSLAGQPQFTQQIAALDEVQRSILDTIGGMGRLLQAERLRHQGAGEAKTGPVDLSPLIASVIAQHAGSAQQRSVKITSEVPATAITVADAELVRLVLQNLMGNAIKYSPSGKGAVRVSAEFPTRGVNAGRWVVAISDNGPGIAADQLDRIFNAFARGEMHGQEGVGLGLAIASRAARLLGAELKVESKVGVGSTFSLVFAPPLKG